MRNLKLSPDWKTSPVRIDYSNGYDDWFDKFGSRISPEDLPLSQELIDEIWAWTEIYDTFLDWDDPKNPVEIDPKVETDFWNQGEVIGQKLQAELGDDYLVSYQKPIK